MIQIRARPLLAAAATVLVAGVAVLGARWPGADGDDPARLLVEGAEERGSSSGPGEGGGAPPLARVSGVPGALSYDGPITDGRPTGTDPRPEQDEDGEAASRPTGSDADPEPGDRDAQPAPEAEEATADAHGPVAGAGATREQAQGLLPRVDPDSLEAVAGRTGIPRRALAAYAGTALYLREQRPGCQLDWALLAAIGYVESHHGTLRGGRIDESGMATVAIIGPPLDGTDDTRRIHDTDGGALDGDSRWDRAVGPMQFIPGTWQGWGVDASGDGEPNPHHIDDAALSAGRYLCASGDLGDADTWWRAVLRYNRSETYTRHVLEYNNYYARRSHGG